MPLLRRWLWPGLLALLLILGLVYAFLPQSVPVDIAAMRRGPLAVAVEDDGITRVREVYVVSAPLAGRVLRIETHAGDTVVADETVLVTLMPSDPAFRDVRAQAELDAVVNAAEAAGALAAAEVERALAELDYARAEFTRARRLFEQGHIAEAAFERARRELRTREAALATSQAALRQRQFELQAARAAAIAPSLERRSPSESGRCCLPVLAPVSGRILRLLQESEAVVVAGAPLVEIGDPADLEIVVDLLSRDAVRVSPGDPVTIARWGGDGTLNGRVRHVEPFGVTKVSALGIEEQRVNVIIDLTDPRDQWQRLGHGYHVDARIVLWQRDDLLLVPLSALFRQGEDWAVFRVDDGRARSRLVTLGPMNDRHAQVTDGLTETDRVILHPSDRVRDGIRVVDRRTLR